MLRGLEAELIELRLGGPPQPEGAAWTDAQREAFSDLFAVARLGPLVPDDAAFASLEARLRGAWQAFGAAPWCEDAVVCFNSGAASENVAHRAHAICTAACASAEQLRVQLHVLARAPDSTRSSFRVVDSVPLLLRAWRAAGLMCVERFHWANALTGAAPEQQLQRTEKLLTALLALMLRVDKQGVAALAKGAMEPLLKRVAMLPVSGEQ